MPVYENLHAQKKRELQKVRIFKPTPKQILQNRSTFDRIRFRIEKIIPIHTKIKIDVDA